MNSVKEKECEKKTEVLNQMHFMISNQTKMLRFEVFFQLFSGGHALC